MDYVMIVLIGSRAVRPGVYCLIRSDQELILDASKAGVLSVLDGWLETKPSFLFTWSCGDGWLSD